MIQVPNCQGGGIADCDACFPPDGETLQFLGIDGGGNRAWLTAPYANYLYNSSGIQQGNRFNDWNDLMAATALIEGPKTITFEQDETIPAGAYDFSNITFRGNFLPLGAGGLIVTLDEGVTFSNVTNWFPENGVGFVNNSSTPNLVIGNGEFVIVGIGANTGFASTNAPMFVVEAGANFVVGAFSGGVIADLGQPVIEVQAGVGFAAFALNGTASEIQDNTITGNGAVFLRLIQSVVVNMTDGLNQPAFSGVVVDQLFTDARALGYNPATSGGVLTSTNVQDAIDELAAQPVFQFEGADATISASTDIAVFTSFLGPGNVVLELPAALAGRRLKVWNNDDVLTGNGQIALQGADTWHSSAAVYAPSPNIVVTKSAELYCITDGEWIVHVTV